MLIQDQTLATLLKALPPLKALELDDDVRPQICHTIITKHGAQLTRLKFAETNRRYPRWDPSPLRYLEFMDALVNASPNIESLTITARRTLRDEQEVKIYRSIGQLKRLRDVSILLECMPSEPSSVLRPLPEDSARRLLHNAACDERLAESIFNIIYPPTAFPEIYLRKLDVRVHGSVSHVRRRQDPYKDNAVEVLTNIIGRRCVVKQRANLPVEIKCGSLSKVMIIHSRHAAKRPRPGVEKC